MSHAGLPIGVECPMLTGTGCVRGGPHAPQDRPGPRVSPVVLIGFTVLGEPPTL